MSLRVPEAHHNHFRKFLSLPSKTRQALLSALRQAQPALSIGKLADHIFTKIKRTGITRDDTFNLISMLTGMYSAQTSLGMSPKPFVDEVFEFFEGKFKEKFQAGKGKGLKQKDVQGLKQTLIGLLSSKKALGISAKANEILQEHEHVFRSARILTDIRPVFGEDPKKDPNEAVLVHMLKIMYTHGDFHKEFFVALDSNDVDVLSHITTRAREKDQSIRSLLRKKQIHLIETRPEAST